MTGLSIQPLFSADSKPLLTLLEARPIGTDRHSGFSLRTRLGGTMPGVMAVRVMMAAMMLVKDLRSRDAASKTEKNVRNATGNQPESSYW